MRMMKNREPVHYGEKRAGNAFLAGYRLRRGRDNPVVAIARESKSRQRS